MLARVYFIGGCLLLGGYGVNAWQGWEYGNAVRMATAPAAGSAMTASSGGRVYHSSSSSSGSRSGWVIFGGK